MSEKQKNKRKQREKTVHVSSFLQRVIAFSFDISPIIVLTLLTSGACGWIDFSRIPPDSRWALLDLVADVVHQQGFGVLQTCVAAGGFAWLYGTLSELLFQGTPGTRVLGCRLVDRLGQRPGGVRVAWRNVCKLVSFGLLGLGGVWAAFDVERRTLHDRLSGTYVVREDVS